MDSLTCPSCGASLPVETRFVKVVICEYCGQSSLLKNRSLDPTGEKVNLASVDSILKIGTTGTLRGEPFKVLGMLRYSYEDGFWDEWFLELQNGKKRWLQEDEGEFTSFGKESITSPIPPYKDINVGSSIQVNDLNVFITEKNRATISGGLGRLMFQISPGDKVEYVDGNASGKLLAIEFTPEEINLSIGESISLDEIELDES